MSLLLLSAVVFLLSYEAALASAPIPQEKGKAVLSFPTRCGVLEVTRDSVSWRVGEGSGADCPKEPWTFPRFSIRKVEREGWMHDSVKIKGPTEEHYLKFAHMFWDYARLAIRGHSAGDFAPPDDRVIAAIEKFDSALSREQALKEKLDTPPRWLAGADPALAFLVWHWTDCFGILYVSQNRVRFEPFAGPHWPEKPEHAFSFSRTEATNLLWKGDHVELKLRSGKKYNLAPLTGSWLFGKETVTLSNALDNFAAVLANPDVLEEIVRENYVAGDFERSRTVAERLCKLQTSNDVAHHYFGRSLFKLGRAAEALPELERAPQSSIQVPQRTGSG